MFWKYAQYDLETGIVYAISYLAGEVTAPDMIFIGDRPDEFNPLGWVYDGTDFIPPADEED